MKKIVRWEISLLDWVSLQCNHVSDGPSFMTPEYWINMQLVHAGFDLSGPIERVVNLETGSYIYTQEI